MEDKSKKLLEETIEKRFSDYEFENDQKIKKDILDSVISLYKLKIESDKNETERLKNEADFDLTEDKNRKEEDFRAEQLKEQKTDRFVNIGLQVGLTILGIVSYDIWNRRGLKFEETGTITSPMTRNLFSKMLPKR